MRLGSEECNLDNLPIRIVAVLVENFSESMTISGLASWLNVSVANVESGLRTLRYKRLVKRLPDSRVHATETARESLLSPRQREAWRKCLTCLQMFWSQHAGNRMCELCSRSDTVQGMHDIPAVDADSIQQYIWQSRLRAQAQL